MTKHLESWLQNFPVLLSIRKFIIYFHGYHLLIFVILLTFFYYSVTDLQHRVSSRGTAWWLSISIHHKMILLLKCICWRRTMPDWNFFFPSDILAENKRKVIQEIKNAWSRYGQREDENFLYFLVILCCIFP